MRDQFPFNVLVKLMQVDVTKDWRNYPALRAAAERFMVFPVFQVPGSQHVSDEPQEPLVVDLFPEYPEEDFMVQRPEAVGDITLNKPGSPRPGVAYLPQRGVTPSPLPEPVRPG